MRLVLKKLLLAHGFSTVIDASDGQDALTKLVGLGAVDLVLIDWNMPVMNGLELTTALREDPRFERTFLMMVTAESDPANIAVALAAGVDEYVLKPFTAESMREKLVALGLAAAA